MFPRIKLFTSLLSLKNKSKLFVMFSPEVTEHITLSQEIKDKLTALLQSVF